MAVDVEEDGVALDAIDDDVVDGRLLHEHGGFGRQQCLPVRAGHARIRGGQLLSQGAVPGAAERRLIPDADVLLEHRRSPTQSELHTCPSANVAFDRQRLPHWRLRGIQVSDADALLALR